MNHVKRKLSVFLITVFTVFTTLNSIPVMSSAQNTTVANSKQAKEIAAKVAAAKKAVVKAQTAQKEVKAAVTAAATAEKKVLAALKAATSTSESAKTSEEKALRANALKAAKVAATKATASKIAAEKALAAATKSLDTAVTAQAATDKILSAKTTNALIAAIRAADLAVAVASSAADKAATAKTAADKAAEVAKAAFANSANSAVAAYEALLIDTLEKANVANSYDLSSVNAAISAAVDAGVSDTYTARISAKKAEIAAAIAKLTPAVSSVSISPTAASVVQGNTKQLTALVTATGGAADTLNWTSSNAKVTVSASGLVTVAADAEPGNYTITATSTFDNTKTGTSIITVVEAPAVTNVSVNPPTASVVQGGTKQLSATVAVVGGAAQTLTWSSSDTNNKVTVNGTGLVTVAADASIGNYTITATSTVDGSKKGTSTIEVTAAPAVTSVSVNPTTASVVQGGTKQLTAAVAVVGGAAQTVNWSSSDANNKVTVDASGLVTVAADATTGNYTITATSAVDGSKKGTATITVAPAPAVMSVTVAPATISIAQGGFNQLAATVIVVGGAAQTVNWSSSDTNNKVTVNATGLVAVAADAAIGNYTITATSTIDGSKKGTALIKVTEAPAVMSVTVAPTTANVVKGGTQQLTAAVDVVGGAAQTVNWSSSDTNNKVTVNSNGLVTVAPEAAIGNYTITATSTVNGTKKGTATITVIPTISQKYAEAMEPGWNLGNSFDAVGDKAELSWSNPPVTKELIDSIKAQGFKSIRIPLTVYGRIGAAPTYTIDPAFLGRYAQVVQWAVDAGLYAIINIHHDSWNWAQNIGSNDDGASMHEYKAIWGQLADYFKDYSDKVCFESLNEPQFTTGDTANQIKILEQVNTTFHKIVRDSGGKNASRMLVLPTLNTNDSDDKCESLYNTIKGFNDPNIMATFHFYGFWPFSVNIAGVTTFDAQTVSELRASFDRIYNHFTNKGIGVVCGEYGLLSFDNSVEAVEHGEALKYFEYVNYYAKSKGITMMLWDNGGLISRTNYTWNDQSLYNMISASWETRSSYTESDRVFLKDTDLNKDVAIKLIQNGNELQSIYNGNEKLVLGVDYTYANDTVTLKKEYVSKVTTANYGINATLTLKFSKGTDWNVYLIHYSTPVLSGGSGSTSGYTIPVSFNGSRLSTMEATYTDGSGAGTNDWTTYKEYGKGFTVDYTRSSVTMTSDFFAASKDGEINLKFHFQSGEVLDYKVVKSGNVVTGWCPKAISSIKYDFRITNVTTPSSITFKITDSGRVEHSQTIQLTGDGNYSVSFDLNNVSGLSDMGYFVTDAGNTAIATLKRVTVNGIYEMPYNATLKVNSTSENGLKNISSGLTDGQKIAEGLYGYIVYKGDWNLLRFYMIDSKLADLAKPITTVKYDFNITNVTPGESITFKMMDSNWGSPSQTIQLTGDGNYSVSFDSINISALKSLGWVETNTNSNAVLKLTKMTVNDIELDYEATLKVNSTSENSLKNIWSGLVDGQKVTEGLNAFIAYQKANDSLIFYTIAKAPTDVATPISSIKYDFSITNDTSGTMTFTDQDSNWAEHKQTINLTGAGNYSVSFNFDASIAGFKNLGYLKTDTGAVAKVTKLTVNGIEMTYDASHDNANDLSNIWNGTPNGQKIAVGNKAYIVFTNDLIILYTQP